jgi:hypothetical protein
LDKKQIEQFVGDELGMPLEDWQLQLLHQATLMPPGTRVYLDVSRRNYRGSMSKALESLLRAGDEAHKTAEAITRYKIQANDESTTKGKPKPSFARFTEPERRRKNRRN